MYNIKIVRRGESFETGSVRSCVHFEITKVDPKSVVGDVELSRRNKILRDTKKPGIYLQLMPQNEIVSINEDGESIFVTNADTGRTVDAYHWPPRQKTQ